ncbi:MAG: family 78 glycoside hydrolase catalytic domain, partial [Clostridia bacterium]|nr:family 78 glycoside hydrolase catalytic domain [Clostridia bacterium]
EVVLRYGELLRDGELDQTNIAYNELSHIDRYTLKGGEKEHFMPHFIYHGFRFVEVMGITEEQATLDLLTFYEMSSSLKRIGDFRCDNKEINALFDAAIQSDRANFIYFPTDCPQREKNGWTGDAALSADQFLTYFDCSASLKEWLRNIFKAQNEEGAIPGIVPTNDWGFAWGNGPAWDNVMFELPYRIYQHAGETDILVEAAPYLLKYLRYMETKADENGLFHYGLGDWLHVQDLKDSAYLVYTDTITCKNICDKAALIFEVIGDSDSAEYARTRSQTIKEAFRSACMRTSKRTGHPTLRIKNQATQAMAIYYGLFSEEEIPFAVKELEQMVKMHDYHMDVGCLGGRVLWHVLADHGMIETAMKTMLNPTFPSYFYWLKQGATALFEAFVCTDHAIDEMTSSDPWMDSLNHHFWGDIIAVFMRYLAGIQVNHYDQITIAPSFTELLNNVSAYTDVPGGRIAVEYKKINIMVEMTVTIPKNTAATLKVPFGYRLSYGKINLKPGENRLLFCKI